MKKPSASGVSAASTVTPPLTVTWALAPSAATTSAPAPTSAVTITPSPPASLIEVIRPSASVTFWPRVWTFSVAVRGPEAGSGTVPSNVAVAGALTVAVGASTDTETMPPVRPSAIACARFAACADTRTSPPGALTEALASTSATVSPVVPSSEPTSASPEVTATAMAPIVKACDVASAVFALVAFTVTPEPVALLSSWARVPPRTEAVGTLTPTLSRPPAATSV